MHIGKKDEPEKSPEREALERQVDAMMDPKLPDGAASDTSALNVPPSALAIEQPAPKPAKKAGLAKTAPELPSAGKKIPVSDASAKPLSIDKLDQLTERIVAGDKEPEPLATTEPEEPDITEQSADLDNSRTDEAVDDIVAHEGDVMLAVADAKVAERERQAETASGKKKSHGGFRVVFWFLIALMALLAIAISVLVVTGGNPSLPKL